MGLFGFGKEKKAKAEAAVKDALIRHPSIQILMENIISPPENHQWLNTVGGYYDSRLRTVIVAKDTLGVHCCPPSELTKQDSNHEAVRVTFTELGYTPLPGYKDENGDYILEVSKVAELFAEEVKQRIAAACPNYALGNVIVDTDSDGTFQVAYFTYRLPALQWKSWF